MDAETIVNPSLGFGDPNVYRNKFGETFLYAEVSRLLGDQGCDRAGRQEKIQKRVETIRTMLENGADPNISAKCGTPLRTAAFAGNLEVVRLLLDYGADVNEDKPHSQTALKISCKNRNPTITMLLLERGADPNLRSKHGETCLGFAERAGRADLVELFEKYGGV